MPGRKSGAFITTIAASVPPALDCNDKGNDNDECYLDGIVI